MGRLEKMLALLFFAFGLSSFAAAQTAATSTATSQDSKMTNIQTIAQSSSLLLEFRGAVIYSDNGMAKHEVLDASEKTTYMVPQSLRLSLFGQATDNVAFYVRYSFKDSKTELANLKWNFLGKQYAIFGIDKLLYAGWHLKDSGVFTLVESDYFKSAPFQKYGAILGYQAKLGGNSLTLQLTNEGTETYTTEVKDGITPAPQKQPAALLEWTGDFSGLMPLLQYGIYNGGKGEISTFGLKYKNENLVTSLDYTVDTPNNDEKKYKKTNLAFYSAYNFGSYEPFLGFTQYDNNQGSTDLKGNYWDVPLNPNGTVNTAKEKIDGPLKDNGQHILLGSFILQQEKKFRPYLAVDLHSADFYKAPTNGAPSAGETETLTNTSYLFGFAGAF